MKNISKLFVIITMMLLLVSISFSQEWVRLMNDPTSNFYDVQSEFYKYWEGKTPQRGQGWMPFKRWEYFMEPRVYPTGNRPDPTATYREMQKYRNVHKDRVNDESDWTSMGPTKWLSISYNPGIGRINCITAHPVNPDIIYAGAPSGGLWKSTNGGLNWTILTDHLSVIGVSGIVVTSRTPSTIYIATGDGDGGATYSIGVLKSTDDGATWDTTGLSYPVSQGARINKLISSPLNRNILFAACTNGLFRSTNGAATWTQVLTGHIRDIEFNPSDLNIYYAVTTSFYKSTDGGESFFPTGTGLPSAGLGRMAIGVSRAGANYVYILAANSSDGGFLGFYRSTDAGATFKETITTPNILGYSPDGSQSGGQGWYDLCVAVSPINPNIVYTGGINIWKSTNGGDNFTCNAYWVWPPDQYGYVHADVHTLDFYGNTLYTGTDGGLFKSTNFGTNWADISEGMATTQFYRFGGTPQNPNLLIGGTQDNGSNMYVDGVWTHVLGADGMEAAVDPTNENILYCSRQNGGLNRSTDGGNNFVPIYGGITGTGGWITPFVLDPVRPATIYTGFQDIWKSDDKGDTWTKLSSLNVSSFRAIAIAKSDNNYIYALNSSTVYRTTNNGIDWKDITTGLPGNAKTYVDVSDSDPLELWVTLSGYVAGEKVYHSTNAGDSWTNVSGTLPNLPANCIKYLNPDRLFIGMDVGVYYTDYTLTDWQPFMVNLPNVEVSEFEIYAPTNKIRAATYGRGIWESPIPPMVGISSNGNNIPYSYALHQNYPNPFNPRTTIKFDLAAKGMVSLKIFNILGQEIKTLVNSEQTPGTKTVTWDGTNNAGITVTSGIYIYELKAGDFRDTKKMVFLK
ncbi:MAG: T9SS C-terminal target domain-containing protein [Ignavibacteriae bacterium]|nr:MAG: T9SS C-terminal target domain-containing protein [Ignavibacteriota bacterium]